MKATNHPTLFPLNTVWTWCDTIKKGMDEREAERQAAKERQRKYEQVFTISIKNYIKKQNYECKN